MPERITADWESEGFYDELQLETVLAERKEREDVRATEIEFLEKAKTHAEFRAAREEMGKCVTDDTLALDEAPYRDYRLRRNAGEGK